MTSSMSEPTPVVGWNVIGQNETSTVTPDGRVEQGMTVRFQTADGTVGSVFVPNYQYSAEQVRQMIATRAAQIDGVANLSATPSQ